MGEAVESAILAVLRALALAVPAFATWLASVVDGQDDPFSRRVADIVVDILPVRSPAHDALDTIRERKKPP